MIQRLPLLFLVFICLCASTVSAQTSISGIINTYREVTAITGLGSVELTSTSGFNQGDKVLVIQMQGASIYTAQDDSFGVVSEYNGAGSHEWCTVCEVNGTELVFEKQFKNIYSVGGSMQVVDIPQYTNAIVTATLTAQDWNGQSGGILIFEVSGTLTLGATIEVTNKGFRGGSHDESTYNCNFQSDKDDYGYTMSSGFGGEKGEGIAERDGVTEAGRGPLGNGGGGGNDHNAGGGGGGNGSVGGQGGENQDPGTFTCHGYYPGIGGRPLSTGNTRVFMGGGGGAGHSNSQWNSSGGDGGGIVIITANTLIGNAQSIRADGQIGENGFGDGSGGGGAGGTIVLEIQNYTGSVFAQTRGADGGSSDNYTADRCFGPGGGGAGGVVWVSAATQPAAVTEQQLGGVNGVVTNTTNSACAGQSLFASSGSPGIVQTDYVMPTGNKGNQACNYIAQVDLGDDITYLCSGATLILDAGPDGTVSYTWNTGETTQTINVTTGGWYIVEVLDTLCPVCDSTFVIVLPSAAVNLGADLTPCDTTIITLNAGAGTNMTYSWSTGETSQTILVPADGNYSVTIDNGGCSATDDINVAFYPTPILPAETILEICDAPDVTLDAENAGMTYNWSTGETTQTIVVDEAMSYTVLISSGPTCILDATYVVTRCNVDVLIANTMTPNGDGRNDTFIIEGIQNFPGTTLLVFNRDGVLLYESNNYNNDWDGDGLPATTYYYMIDLNLDGETYQGTINIIRE